MQNSGLLRITWRGLPGYLLLVLLFLLLLKTRSRLKKMNTINETGKNVCLMLIEAGFSPLQAQYITAQSAHETANFTSPVFLQNNNLFGYKYVGQAVAKGEKNGHAVYANLTDSIQDYQTYYRLRRYPKIFNSLAEFVKALKRNGYFQAPEGEYLRGVIHFYKLYFGNN